MSPLDLLMAAPLGFMAAALMLGPSGRWLILLAGVDKTWGSSSSLRPVLR